MRLPTATFTPLLLVALGLAGIGQPACAQDSRSFNHSLTLAPADASSAGGGGAGGGEAAKSEELAKAANNPVAAMYSLPIQNNFDFGIGPADAMQYKANVQPVLPFTINKDWNLISRTILPLIYQESRFAGDGSHGGLGDTLQSLFFSPAVPPAGNILGIGPALLLPTATDSVLGTGKWAAGPSILWLRQDKGFTYGILANHIWDYAGWGDSQVNATFLQPMFGYTTKALTTFMLNTETTYNWPHEQATVPINFMATQLLKIGKQPLTIQLGYRYYVEKPDGGPNWGIRIQVTFLFPRTKG